MNSENKEITIEVLEMLKQQFKDDTESLKKIEEQITQLKMREIMNRLNVDDGTVNGLILEKDDAGVTQYKLIVLKK